MATAKQRLIHFYDARAEKYDTEEPAFHNRLAADFVVWAASYLPPELVPEEDAPPPPTPPPFSPYAPGSLRHLDLCCGTGLVAFASLARFGKDATIHGVDFSSASLDVARCKCPSRTFTVDFHLHDLMDGLPEEVMAMEWDLITCCSAFVLLPFRTREDRVSTVELWQGRLASGGVLMFDVPMPNTHLFTQELHRALKTHCGLDGEDTRGWIKDEGSVEDLLVDSGFDEDMCYVFESEAYKRTEVRADKNELLAVWEKMIKIPYFAEGIEGVDEERKGKAKDSFVQALTARAVDGVIVDEYKFYIAVGRKKEDDDEDNMEA